MKTSDAPLQSASARWANRILILSLVGIAYLTFFPFRFDFSPTTVFHRSPFLLVSGLKLSGPKDVFLNILLFVPFGFGVSAQARKRGYGAWSSFLLALAAGAFTSYLVELLQFYIPERDSGWEDVFTNGSGSVAGFCIFQICGGPLLGIASFCEDGFEQWLTAPRAALLLAAYFTVWFAVSARLQSETRLSNWDPQSTLVVGNDAAGENPWQGQVFRLQIWNRALPEEEIQRIARQQSTADSSLGLLGSYDFTGSPPYRDKTNASPPLDWTPEQPQLVNDGAPEWSAYSWLKANTSAENLMGEIMKTSRFTVHVVCTPAGDGPVNGRIVSFSRSAGNVNFLLREEGQYLVFRLRNPITTRRALLGLAWYVPGAFEPGKARDIVASYDGADEFLYLDGIRVPQDFQLGPGASLMRRVRFIEPRALEAYTAVYETLVFLTGGLLIGLATRKWRELKLAGRSMLALWWILPPALLELLLVAISGRRIWVENIAWSLVFGLAGIFLANADRRLSSSAR